ncbi:MAG: DUF4837 family protein [Flavobacteriales bacterium]
MRAFYLLLIVLFAACEIPDAPLPGITGKAGELVVVMDEVHWKTEAGDTVFNSLARDVYGLPQPEPMFNVVHIKSAAFTKIFQTHRNIVYAKIGKSEKASIELVKNKWANPQVVVEIKAPNIEEFVKLFGNNSSKIIGHILNAEEERTLKSYKAQINEGLTSTLRDKYGVGLVMPKGYKLISEEQNFAWLRHDNKEISQNILIYSEPYTRANTFSKAGMIEAMSGYCKAHVPGPDAGTFMSIYTDYPPAFNETSITGKYAAKLTGLWDVDGALMGGPFVCYAMLDPTETTVTYVHGFVFAPGKKKRNYLRQVDAILNSVSVQ